MKQNKIKQKYQRYTVSWHDQQKDWKDHLQPVLLTYENWKKNVIFIPTCF